MILEHRAQSVVEKKMLPNEWWGSCHEVTDKPQGCGYASERQEVSESLGADCEAIGDRGILNSSLLTPNSSLLFNAGGIK